MKRLLALCLSALFLSGCADTLTLQTNSFKVKDAHPGKRIAVVDFAGEGGQAIADILTINFLRAGFEIVERDRLGEIVKQQEIGKSGMLDLSDDEKAKLFGRILNADVIVTGQLVRMIPPQYEKKDDEHLTYQGATIQLSARAFDAKTGKVFWTCVVNGVASARTGAQLGVMDYVNEPCAELVSSFKQPEYADVALTLSGEQIAELRKKRGF